MEIARFIHFLLVLVVLILLAWIKHEPLVFSLNNNDKFKRNAYEPLKVFTVENLAKSGKGNVS